MAYDLLAGFVLLIALTNFLLVRHAAAVPNNGFTTTLEDVLPPGRSSLALRQADATPEPTPPSSWERVLDGRHLANPCVDSNDYDNGRVCGSAGFCISTDQQDEIPVVNDRTATTTPLPSSTALRSVSGLILDTESWSAPTTLVLSAPSSSSTMESEGGGLGNSATVAIAVVVPFSVITIFGILIIVFRARRRRIQAENEFHYPAFDKIRSLRSPSEKARRPSTRIYRLQDTDGALEISPPRPPRTPDLRTFTYTRVEKPLLVYNPSRQPPSRTHRSYKSSSRTTPQASPLSQTPVWTPRSQTPLLRSAVNSPTPTNRSRVNSPEIIERPRSTTSPPQPPPKDAGHKSRRPLAPRRLQSSPGDLYKVNMAQAEITPSHAGPERPPPAHFRTGSRPSIHTIASSPDIRQEKGATLSPSAQNMHTRLASTPELDETWQQPHLYKHPLSPYMTPQHLNQTPIYPTLQATPSTPIRVQHSPSLPHHSAAELEGCDAANHLPSHRWTRHHHPDEAFDLETNYNTPSWRKTFAPSQTPTPPPKQPRSSSKSREAPSTRRETSPPISRFEPGNALADDSPTLPRNPTWFNARMPSPLSAMVGAVRTASVKSTRSITRSVSRSLSRSKTGDEEAVEEVPIKMPIPTHPPPPPAVPKVTTNSSAAMALTSCPVSPQTVSATASPAVAKDSPVSALTPRVDQAAWPVPKKDRGPRRVFQEVESPQATEALNKRLREGLSRSPGGRHPESPIQIPERNPNRSKENLNRSRENLNRSRGNLDRGKEKNRRVTQI